MGVTGNWQAQGDRAVEHDAANERWLAALWGWERHLTLAAINEAIRLLESEQFRKLTDQHVRCIAEYGAITIDEESFFDKAFSTGKEVAACLAYALDGGSTEVLEDLARLRVTLVGPSRVSGPLPAVTISTAHHDAGMAI